MKKTNLIAILILTIFLSGCSLIKMASQPFKNTVSKVPESIKKSERKITCKGEITLDALGRVTKCGSNYYLYEKNFSQEERKLKWREKISQFVLNAKGYLLWGVIICIVLSFSGFGWVVGAIWSGIRGAGKIARDMSRTVGDLVRGISKGKKYIRNNGDKYNEDERKIYQKALDDMMAEISKSVNTKESKQIINKLRVEE